MVIGDDGESGVEEGRDEVKVASGVFAETVDEMNDSGRRGGRCVKPAVDGIAVVARSEVDFINRHGRTPRVQVELAV
ncbi:hypothetical protein [Brevibacterium sp. FAM 27836]|uniref:hypothetical protein n=1 Tax=Brevibacterium sp. FAM 27836 TaxID=3446693 RepID=UPI003F510248